MTQGGPGRATELFVYAIYEQVFLDLSVGRASALTVVFFAMLLALSRPAAPRLARARGRGAMIAARAGPRSGRASAALPYARGLVAAAAWVVPYAWMVATSFKTLPEIVAHPTAPLPEHLDLGAYREVFAAMPVARYMAVTIVMAGAIATAQVALALPAGYALAKLRFAGSRFAFGDRARVPARAGAGHVRPGVSHVREGRAWSTRWRRSSCPSRRARSGRSSCARRSSACPTRSSRRRAWTAPASGRSSTASSRPMLRPTLVSLFLVSFVFHYSDYFWPLVMTTDDTRPHAAARRRAPARAGDGRALAHRHGRQRRPLRAGPRPLRRRAEAPFALRSGARGERRPRSREALGSDVSDVAAHPP